MPPRRYTFTGARIAASTHHETDSGEIASSISKMPYRPLPEIEIHIFLPCINFHFMKSEIMSFFLFCVSFCCLLFLIIFSIYSL
jgi:hypothetical protein